MIPSLLKHTGFTGSREGMTRLQWRELAERFSRMAGWLHHGMCVGADWQAHDLARAHGLLVAGHPPTNARLLAVCECDFLHAPKDYIARNHAIVDATSELLATPKDMQEQMFSGTWATIRYARKRHKMVTIIYPDGSLEFSP